jgi:hypothetical protein
MRLLLFVALSALTSLAQPLVLEAEKPSRKSPAGNEFAVATGESAACGGRVLTRFFKPGVVFYDFTVEKPGVVHVWVRYGAKGARTFRVALDPAEGPPVFQNVQAEATGGFIGPGVWAWVKLASAELGPGKHTIALGNTALRLDCLAITDQAGPITDEALGDRMGKVKLDEETQALLAKSLPPVHPDWLDSATDYRLPKWYDQIRVCLHTRLSPAWMDREGFYQAAAGFRQLGAREFVRHIKTGSEGAWWPSEVGAVHPKAQERNIARELIENARQQGTRFIIYHRHMEDAHLAGKHPDWRAVNAHGEPYMKRGPKVCLNSPYADFVQTRLLELVDMGADGFYFDEVHMPKACCWCRFCQKRFEQETGLEPPITTNPGNPIYHRYVDFKNTSVERVFRKWRQAIHARNPECILLIGSNSYPSLTERHTTHRLYRIADAMKTEFKLPIRAKGMFSPPPGSTPMEPDAKLALGYAVARDAADGRPPHIWCHGLRDEVSAVYATAGMIAHGCVANLDISEKTIPNEMFRPALTLGNRVSPAFAGSRPSRWALVHYPETARDRYLYKPQDASAPILHPLYGMFRTLLRARLPVGVITDNQLEEPLPTTCRVLLLPTPNALTPGMAVQVQQFAQRGGLVIRNRPSWAWHEPTGLQPATDALLAALAAGRATAPSHVTGGPATLHAITFEAGPKRRTVALVNDFLWVKTGRHKPGEKEVPPTVPPPCRQVRVHFPKAPQTVRDLVSGKQLPVQPDGTAGIVQVPEFGPLAVLVAEW